MGLSLLLHSELHKKLYSVRWGVAVVQGHLNWYQSKAHMQLPVILPL